MDREKKIQRKRKWQSSPYKSSVDDARKTSVDFTVMSYNILSQEALQYHPHLYHRCKPGHLDWSYRAVNLLEDLYSHEPEIICLQELEEKEYQNIFLRGLIKKGYDGVFKKKTGNKIDGCAIFFKKEKFHLIEAIPIEFHRQEVSFLNRDNIALICIFRPTESHLVDKRLFVANTHLLFNPKRDNVRLSQLRILLAELEKRAFRALPENDGMTYHPIVVCGDFNFTPSSSLYDFLAFGAVVIPRNFSPLDALNIDIYTKYADSASNNKSVSHDALITRRAVHPTDSLKQDSCHLFEAGDKTVILSHSLKLVSAYGDIISPDQRNTATTFHANVNDKVDYIFFNVKNIHYVESQGRRIPQLREHGNLVPLQCYKLLMKQDMENLRALPNGYFSSDHTYIMAQFKLI